MSSTKYKQNLDITGDITLSGNINIGGGTIAGDADTDSVTFNADVTSNIIPDVNTSYDLGSNTKTWRELFTSKINSAVGDDLDIHSGSDISFYPTGNIWIKQNTKLIFEGTAPDEFEAKLQATSVTADRDIILPDASGTIALTSDIPVDISELTNDAGYITSTNDTLTLTPQATVPVSPSNGMLAVSDGIGWDPATDGIQHLNIYLNGIWTQII
jgi:hypothetical protein